MNVRTRLARIRPDQWAQILVGLSILVILLVLVFAKKPWEVLAANGDDLRIPDYVSIYSWWAGLLNLVPLAVLGLAAKLWLRPIAPTEPRPVRPAFSWFWPLVGLAMLVAVGASVSRLGHSLWDDEEYTLRRVVLGSYRIQKNGEPKLKQVPWSDTLWYYKKPNNHMINSVAARVSNSIWRGITRPSGLQFSETALRLPAFLAGIASVAVWALLLRSLGFAGSGAVAAWLIALHPWHERFVPEVRGYALVFLFLPLAIWLAVRAAREGSWPSWVLYGLSQVLLFLSWPGTIFTLALLNLSIVVGLAVSRRPLFLARWLVVTMLAGAICLQLYLPCAAQLSAHMNDWDASGLGWPWVQNVGSRLLVGIPWKTLGGTYPQLTVLLTESPWLSGAALAAVSALLVLGSARCLAGNGMTRCLLAVLVVPGTVTYLFARLRDTHLFEWYLVFMVPGLMALVALGLGWLLGPLARRNAIAAGVAAAVFLLLFAVATQPARNRMLAEPVQFLRESVLATRPNLDFRDARNQKILTVTTLATPEVYDPNIHRVKTGEELARLLRKSDATGYPLFVNQGYTNILEIEAPELAQIILDPKYFEQIAELPGMESMFDRQIFRYRAGSFTP